MTTVTFLANEQQLPLEKNLCENNRFFILLILDASIVFASRFR